jgi:hypothetical protein
MVSSPGATRFEAYRHHYSIQETAVGSEKGHQEIDFLVLVIPKKVFIISDIRLG